MSNDYEAVDDQLADFRERSGYDWPNCATPDCEHKACVWAGTGQCYPCSERRLGKSEMDRRWAATRVEDGLAWNGIPYRSVPE